MRPAFESIGSPLDASFLVKRFREHTFSAPYHFHPEYELTLIVEGKGLRYVGSHSEEYIPGDLVLLGPHLPHCWKTIPAKPATDSASIVVQFGHACLGEDFFSRPEMHTIAALLTRSRSGSHFKGATQPLQDKMIALAEKENGLPKLLAFLDILQDLAAWQHYNLLDKPNDPPTDTTEERLQAVVSYIIDHFRQEISLQKAAAIANMTTSSFCRWFRRVHRRSFMQVVIDYRIDSAMHQLVYSEDPIAQIAFDCGFNDISNFHKAFRSRQKISPLHYRKRFHNGLVSSTMPTPTL